MEDGIDLCDPLHLALDDQDRESDDSISRTSPTALIDCSASDSPLESEDEGAGFKISENHCSLLTYGTVCKNSALVLSVLLIKIYFAILFGKLRDVFVERKFGILQYKLYGDWRIMYEIDLCYKCFCTDWNTIYVFFRIKKLF